MSGSFGPSAFVGIHALRQDSRAVLASADGQFDVPRLSAEGALDVRASQGVTTSGSETSAAVLFTLDCQEWQSVAVQVTSAGTTCTISYETSNDGTSWFASMGFQETPNSNAASSPISSSTALQMMVFPVGGRYFRARVSTYTAGTVSAVAFAKAIPATQHGMSVQLGAGSNTIGALTAGVSAIGDVGQQYRANATGAASGQHVVAAAGTNSTLVKASAGRVLGWSLANTAAAWRYVKLHNSATAPTAGAGVVRSIGIPPGGISNFVLEGGIGFATGIGLTIVTGSADVDATAVSAGDVVGELFFA